ncbi:MAG: DUF2786 domain-containing protein [Rhodomicrobium sp.]
MKQGKPTAAGTDSLFIDQLQKLHGDLRVVGQKAVDCVLPAKIQAKATDFLHGVRDAPDVSWRALDAAGYAIDVHLFTPSMSGHTAIDRAMRTGKIGGAEMEAAKLLRHASFRLLEITEDRGGGLLAATDLVSNERLTIFDPASPMARGGRWARRTCLYQGVHVTVGPVTPLDDGMLAVAAPFMDKGRGLKKPLRCAEALYEHFIRHGDPLDGVDPALLEGLDDDEDAFPFDVPDGPLHALAAEWAQASQLPEPDAGILQLIRSEAYEEPVFEMHNASYHANRAGEARLAAAYGRILSLQLETVHRRASVGIRASFETLDSLAAKLKEGGARGEIPADAIAHFEEMCRRAKLAGSAKTNKGSREELDKVLSRIQALRGKTVEQGCTEAEALLAAGKVAELLDQYGLTLSETGMKAQSCAGEGIETNRRRRSPLDECAGAIAGFCDCRTWYEMTPQGHIRHIFFGLPADVAGARYLYEKIGEAFETETAEFKRSELYDQHPSAKRRSATASFQAGLGHGICAKLNRLKAERAAAFRASGGRDLVPVKRDVIEDELAALGMRLKVLQTGRKNLLAMAYKKGRVTGENLEWEEKLAAA